ncbi:protein TAPETUM DETERMINANT 1-like [Rutidosis leptorrhynchoides]|uniref:protein TAPETUM DETERMINANT 1-like n=1 Tax=Rutidosis leptorrhynchoides TaxID=125765 RepID=UPI003A9A291E
MAAAFPKLFSSFTILLFLALTMDCYHELVHMDYIYLLAGKAQCTLNDFTIGTVRTDTLIGGKSEWKVTVINTCHCGVQQIYLNCKGFQTVEKIDPNIFSVHGDRCLLIGGKLLPSKGSVNFAYAWDPPFLLSPAATTSAC